MSWREIKKRIALWWYGRCSRCGKIAYHRGSIFHDLCHPCQTAEILKNIQAVREAEDRELRRKARIVADVMTHRGILMRREFK